MDGVHVGIDIGTTNITLTSLDLKTRTTRSYAKRPNPRIENPDPLAYEQDPIAIERSVRELLLEVEDPIASICVTGQVHGILYYDEGGEAISPLYTWLDQRAMEIFDNQSSQTALHEEAGVLLNPGYGLLTHYANRRLGSVADNAAGFCGIIEFITSRLTATLPTHSDPTCLATYGGYDPRTSTFDHTLLSEVFGTDQYTFLEPAQPFSIAGETASSIPVAYGVGDNQAGFFAAVPTWESQALISIGTSGQISLFNRQDACPQTMELRPFFGRGFLCVGATLSAGKSYQTLHRLFSSVLHKGGSSLEEEEIYTLMKEEAALLEEAAGLIVDPRFSGSRLDPAVRGSIGGITLENLTMGSLVLATINGIVDELKSFLPSDSSARERLSSLVATGSAVKKNPLFHQALSRTFGLPVSVSQIEEGAGFGAAMIGAIATEHLTLAEREEICEAMNGY